MKKAHLTATAASAAKDKEKDAKVPRFVISFTTLTSDIVIDRLFVKYGLNHIVALIEANKAALVVIAHDVNSLGLSAPPSSLSDNFFDIGGNRFVFSSGSVYDLLNDTWL